MRAHATGGMRRERCIHTLDSGRRCSRALAALSGLCGARTSEDALGDYEVTEQGDVVDRAQLALGQFSEVRICARRVSDPLPAHIRGNRGKRTHVPLWGLLLFVVGVFRVLVEVLANDRVCELDIEVLLAWAHDLIFGRSSLGGRASITVRADISGQRVRTSHCPSPSEDSRNT